ncbi:MAG: sugar phosphate isomerase/epimerase family protein [Sphaerochaeta sp.]|nr:sugar phosphate isomerase/epimerase family protein [Sphaerochaeta sp.]
MIVLGTQDKDFFPHSITEKFNTVRELGFGCFEIDGKLLTEHTKEIKAAIKETGLQVSSACGGYRGWIGDFESERRKLAIMDITMIFQSLSEIGGTGIVVPAAWGMATYRLPPMMPKRTKQEDMEILLDSLGQLDGLAGKYGCSLFLEPLNRYQDHMLNTLEDAYNLISNKAFYNISLTADFYHMSIEEDNMDLSLIQYQSHIAHIHLAENHRYQPGTGAIDFKRHFQTLHSIGYSGKAILECRVRGNDPLKDYKKSVDFLSPML